MKTAGHSQLWSRNQKDFTRRFANIAQALAELPDETAIDGEIIGLDGDGLPAFNRLQDFAANRDSIVFYAFDFPWVGGIDLQRQPLETRREMLREVVAKAPAVIRYSETFDAPPSQLLAVVREKGLEGIVAKRRGSTHQAGKRSDDWVKVRANRADEFIIGGYVPTAHSFEAILVGQREGSRFMYAGSIRAGFAAGSRTPLLAELLRVHAPRCPFANLPERMPGRWGEGITTERMEKCQWLKPRLVATIEFLEWTPENRRRHPRFVGLRIDKPPRQVVRERSNQNSR